MNAITQYRAWLDEEIANAKRESSPFLGGLNLAMSGLILLIESRPATLAGHCGTVTMYPSERRWTVCWQDEGHDGGHDLP